MKLSELSDSEVGVILQVHHDVTMQNRLYDLGFFPGEKVTCLFHGPFQSPIAYLVNGAVIALRKTDADGIEVEDEN